MFRKKIPFIPNDISLFIKRSRFTVSYAFLKSMKTAYNLCLPFLTTFSIIVCRKKIWSEVPLPLMKPICFGESNFLWSIKFIKRLSRTKLNNLVSAELIAMPLKLLGLLVCPFLKIGFRKFKVHLDG